jgi:hypothetical protein
MYERYAKLAGKIGKTIDAKDAKGFLEFITENGSSFRTSRRLKR